MDNSSPAGHPAGLLLFILQVKQLLVIGPQAGFLRAEGGQLAQVRAGEVIGFMGDTGYSEIEGTTGNFDVHLHFGIYLNDKNGKEYAINPYQVLQKLENKKRTLTF